MKIVGTCQLERRQPFKIVSMPVAARLYRYGFGGPPTGRWHRLKQGAARRAFFLLQKSRIPQMGRAVYTRGGLETPWSFDSKNTQFHSLFLPEFAAGYEPEVCGLIDSFLRRDGTFFDVGSNWGYFALYAAGRKDFRGSIVAYEPMPATFRDLENLVRATGLESVVRCVNAAVSAKAGMCRMTVPDGVHSGLARISDGGAGIEIKTVSLWEPGMSRPDFVKIDAEGHEWSILEGARRLFEEVRPFLVFESWQHEVRERGFARIFSFFRELDYTVGFAVFAAGAAGEEKLRYEPTWDESGRGRMTIIEIEAWERQFLRDQLNIFAWPRERQELVAAGGLGTETGSKH